MLEKQISIQSPPDDVANGEINQTSFIPGTVLLVDLDHKLRNAAHSKEEFVFIPQPSSDPDDPLNWSLLRKYSSFGAMFFWAFMLGGATLSPGVTYESVIMELGASLDYLNTGAAIMLLLLGLGNILFTPLALHFGRRPIYLFSAIVAAASQVVAAEASSKAMFIGARMLLGFAAAPFEQLPAVTVADLFFIHQRGFGISLYVLAISSGSFIGPVAAGFVVEGMGWRWVYWFYAIFLGLAFVLIFLFLEETAYTRKVHQVSQNEPEISMQQLKKSYAAKLSLFSIVEDTAQTFSGLILGTLRLLLQPIVLWSGLMYGFAISWLSVMASTTTEVFLAPPYLFTTGAAGCTTLACLVGSVLVLYVGGAGTDRFMVWRARHNGGIMEAESCLWAAFVAGPLMGTGLVLYGVGAAHGIHWIGPVIGMGLIGTALPIAAEVSLSYTSDCYPTLVGEATMAVIVVRNTVGCALTFAIGPWIIHQGLQNTFAVVGCLAFVVFMSAALLVWKGKACRQRIYRK